MEVASEPTKIVGKSNMSNSLTVTAPVTTCESASGEFTLPVNCIRRRHILSVIIVLVVVGTAFLPTLRAVYELDDDHYLLWLSSRARIHEQLPERGSVLEVLRSEMFSRGRIEPIATLLFQFHSRWLVQNPRLHRICMLAVVLVTGWMLFLAGSRLTGSDFGGLLFSIWLMICPAAQNVWPHIVRSETAGMLLISGILFSVTSAANNRRLLSFMGLFLFFPLCFEKENFFLMAPAFAYLAWAFQRAAAISPDRSVFANPFGFLGIGFLAGVSIYVGVKSAGTGSHGAQSLQVSFSQALQVLLGAGGILRTLLANSFWCLPSLVGFAVWIKRRDRVSDRTRDLLVFSGLVLVPQVAIYMTRSSFEGRYAFPMLLGTVLPNTLAALYLWRSCPAWLPRTATAFAFVLFLARCWQIQLLENTNFTTETLAIKQVVEVAVSNIPSHGNAIVVAGPKSEHASAILTMIGYYGRPDCNVYLYQPNGTDGYADYGFQGLREIHDLMGKTVNCVVWLPGMENMLLPEDLTADLTDSTIQYEKLYLSLRHLGLTRIPHKLRYAVHSSVVHRSTSKTVVK